MKSWTKQDSRYAFAAGCALTLIVVLIAFTFGLGPNPLRALVSRPATSLNLPAINANASQPPVEAAAPVAANNLGSVLGLFITNNQAPNFVGNSPGFMTTPPPKVNITTPDGAIVVATTGPAVSGTAQAPAGMSEVIVVFQSATGGVAMTRANLECTSGGTSCTWAASAPGTLGNFKVRARATDVTGTVAESTTRTITVISLTPPQTATSTSSLGGIGALIGQAVNAANAGLAVPIVGGLVRLLNI